MGLLEKDLQIELYKLSNKYPSHCPRGESLTLYESLKISRTKIFKLQINFVANGIAN